MFESIYMFTLHAGVQQGKSKYKLEMLLLYDIGFYNHWISKITDNTWSTMAHLYIVQFGFCFHHSTQTAVCAFTEKVKYF